LEQEQKMSNQFSFKCTKCDEIHSGIPSFSFDAPQYFYGISEEEREKRVFLTSDTCVIDEEYFFAKGFLEIPVLNLGETLSFTTWVSLSESNFMIFQESLDEKDASKYGSMFGWFSSNIDIFGECLNLKTNLVLQNNNYKPIIDIEPTEHPLSLAIQNGISKEKLIEIVEYYLHKWAK
jgi:hypothetical protein